MVILHIGSIPTTLRHLLSSDADKYFYTVQIASPIGAPRKRGLDGPGAPDKIYISHETRISVGSICKRTDRISVG
jgi:hypothetical protein